MIKVKELTKLFGHLLDLADNKYGGLPVSRFRSYLREFTDTLGLQHNKEWQKLCFQWNGNQAQEYLQLNPKELVEYNGMSIKNWKEEVEAQMSSGMTVSEWCRTNNIAPKNYYYHQLLHKLIYFHSLTYNF